MDETTTIDAERDAALDAYRIAWRAAQDAIETLATINRKSLGGAYPLACTPAYTAAVEAVHTTIATLQELAVPLDEYAGHGRRLVRYRLFVGTRTERVGGCVEPVLDRTSLSEHQCKHRASPGTDYCDQHGHMHEQAGEPLRLPRLATWDGKGKEA